MARDYQPPAGPFFEHDIAGTICPICNHVWAPGQAWKWMEPATGDDPDLHVFAGYFCCQLCADTWNACDLRARSYILFGDAEFVDRLRKMRNRVETQADPQGVPVFAGIAKVAYRAAETHGAWRAW